MTTGTVLLALALFLAPTPAAALPAADGYQTGFEEAACPFDVGRQVRTRVVCGYVTDTQNWEAESRRRIRIPVAVVRATAGTSRAAPVVWIGGGPMPDLRRAVEAAASPHWRDRDVVLFDFRGMGAGDAVCPESGPAYARVLTRALTVAESLEERGRLAGDCRLWAEEAGIDLAAYNARNMARDVMAIVDVLGYERWNVDAVSFGTIVAQHLMRLAPAGLNAVVLRGPVPLDQETVHINGFAGALDLMAAYCAREPACASMFPDARSEYQAAFEQLERAPIRLRVPRDDRFFPTGEIFVTGTLLQRIVSDGLYNRVVLAAIPALVRETARGNAVPASTLARVMVQPGTDLNGVNWSGQCDANGAWAARADSFDLGRADENYWKTELSVRCEALGVPPAPAEHRLPVESDLPTLIFVGEHDPITPPAYAAAAARLLRNATILEIPGRGHEFPVSCTDPIVTAFFDAPGTAPDASCLATLREIPFVTEVRPSRGTSRLMLASMGLDGVVLAALALPLVVLIGSVMGWPLAAGVVRLRRRERPARTPFERRARRGAAGFTLLALAFLTVLGWVVVQTTGASPLTLIFGLPAGASPLLLMPWVLLVGSVGLTATAALAWRREGWTRWGRIHFTLVAAASLFLVGLLFVIGLV